jgi:hypothetical protein
MLMPNEQRAHTQNKIKLNPHPPDQKQCAKHHNPKTTRFDVKAQGTVKGTWGKMKLELSQWILYKIEERKSDTDNMGKCGRLNDVMCSFVRWRKKVAQAWDAKMLDEGKNLNNKKRQRVGKRIRRALDEKPTNN